METAADAPAIGVTAVAFCSFGEQSRVPPDIGTKAKASTTYDGASDTCVSVVPLAENAPENTGPALARMP